MGLIGFTDTKSQAKRLANKQKFHKNIKIKPVTAAFGKVAYYEVVGNPKKVMKKVVETSKTKTIISFVKHKGKNVRLSSDTWRKKK